MLKQDRWAVVLACYHFLLFPALFLCPSSYSFQNWLYIMLASTNPSCPFQRWSFPPPPQGLPLSQQPQWTHGALLLLSHPWRAVIPGHPTPLPPLIPGALQLPVLRPPMQVTIRENEVELELSLLREMKTISHQWLASVSKSQQLCHKGHICMLSLGLFIIFVWVYQNIHTHSYMCCLFPSVFLCVCLCCMLMWLLSVFLCVCVSALSPSR